MEKVVAGPNDESTEFMQASNTPISISDAASMFRVKISKNEPPYMAAVKKENNKIVDMWYERVLCKKASSTGQIAAGKVGLSINVFIEGLELTRLSEFIDKIPTISEDHAKYWLEIFKTRSISDLRKMGTGTMMAGWNILMQFIKWDIAMQKIKLIYGSTSDPAEWEKLANKYPHLSLGKTMPFGLQKEEFDDITERISNILNYRIEDLDPKITCLKISDILSKFKMYISKNEKPYAAAVKKENNRIVTEFVSSLEAYYKNNDSLSREQINEYLTIFVEGIELSSLREYLDHIPRVEEKYAKYWYELFLDTPIAELRAIGAGTVLMGWNVLSQFIKFDAMDKKWKNIYISNDPNIWYDQAKKFPDLFLKTTNSLPLDMIEQDYQDITEKIGNILAIKISPDN